jgi:RNA polymerase sigma-70 factor (ECF subfamily)
MDRLRRGEEAAAVEVFHHFARRLIGLARVRLGARLRQKVDPEDILQSVFKSFFVRQAAGAYDLDSWDSLWALLTVITLRKCGYRTRHFRAACRDLQREAAPARSQDDSAANWEAIARDPTPAEAACLTETVEQLLRGFDDRDRCIVELALQGYKAPEISTQVGLAERSVYRVLGRVQTKLERLRAEGEAEA